MPLMLSAVIVLACSSVAASQTAPVQPPVSPPAQPQGGGNTQSADGTSSLTALKPHLLVQQLPDAQACPSPDWITPGTRLTYFSSVAQINDAAGATNLVEDPNGGITDASGKRYREGDAVGQGVGGTGWDCLDIIAVEPGVTVIEMRQFRNTNGHHGPVVTGANSPGFVHPSGCDYFIHPRLLAQLQQSSGGGVSLLRGTLEHRGATYEMVRSTVESSGTRLSSVYDLASGVQLTHNSSAQHDGGVAYKQSGDQWSPQRKTGRSLANNQFAGSRVLDTPWLKGAIPAWAKTAKRLMYRGQRVDSGTPEMGLGRMTTNITMEFTTKHVGETFILYASTLTLQMEHLPPMEPIKGLAVTGPGSLGGLWIDPAVMNTMRTGTLIDHDQNLGVKSGVEYAGPGPDGRPIVVLAFGNELYKLTNTFDAEGRLVGTAKIEKSETTGGMITTQMELAEIE